MDILPATAEHISEIRTLLSANGLPLEGFPQDCALVLALKYRQDAIGGAALEVHSEYGLLRSLVVEAGFQGLGFGESLVRAVLREAAARNLLEVYLLTETAENYFTRLGFRNVTREKVPAPLQNSVEFRGACPDTARAMALPTKKTPVSGS